jgi:hypothetical protein
MVRQHHNLAFVRVFQAGHQGKHSSRSTASVPTCVLASMLRRLRVCLTAEQCQPTNQRQPITCSRALSTD